ncbi:MAG: ECF transporter S component [Chloroflexi bacterium]|nr:ECF transporter S component [Chloroflexota bacterium]
MKFTDSVKRDFSTITFALIPLAIAINLVIGQLASVLNLPIFLDSIGTVVVAILCGPWAGLLTGLITNVVGGLLLDPLFMPFAFVAGVIGLVAGWLANIGMFKNWWKTALSGVIITLAVVIVAAPTRVLVFGGITPTSVGAITSILIASGQGLWQSVIEATFITNLIDKVITALVAFGLAKALPARTLASFPRTETLSN